MARVDTELLIEVTVSRDPSFEQRTSQQDEKPLPPGRLGDSESHKGSAGERRKRLFSIRDVE